MAGRRLQPEDSRIAQPAQLIGLRPVVVHRAAALDGLAASDCGEREEGAWGWPSTPPGLQVVLDGKLDLVACGGLMSPPRQTWLNAAPSVRLTAVAATADLHSQVRRPPRVKRVSTDPRSSAS